VKKGSDPFSGTLGELNTGDRDGFLRAVGWVFEHSPWVAERAWRQKPFATIDELHAAMAAEVVAASAEEQLALLREHPDLGTRARMSRASTGEQAGAGLDSLDAAEFERLNQLNTAYRERFGFPFLYAVKGSTEHDILKALGTRLTSSREEELGEALRQVFRIARFRLDDIFSGRVRL
jgi:2-oxo-4-hydroxy-4-carboxy-5-ureidoimidazoline decarboxylase